MSIISSQHLNHFHSNLLEGANLALDNNATVGGTVTALSGTAPSATPALAVKLGSTAGPGIYFGTGAPAIAAPTGSLYIDTAATTTTTRLYIKTDTGATWASFTASA